MKRTSGRIGVGLVLISTLVGACLTERENGNPSATVARPEPAIPDAYSANDVVVAVRSQIDRAFGTTSIQRSGENTHRGAFNPFNAVGAKTTSVVEFLSMKGVTGEVGKVAAEVVLPAQADGAFRLQDMRSGVSIEVGLVGATKSVREETGGYTVYRAGYDKGAHIVHRTTHRGTEDYVFFPNELPDTPELRYDLALGENVAGLRLVEQTLEMLDAGGAPRLRMAPPYAVDGDGRRLALNVAIEGCAYDSSAELPWDRPIVAPGAKHCIVHLSWDSNARAPLTVDPAWALTGELSVPRLNATSMELPGAAPGGTKSRVIVVGGDSGDPTMAHNTTEVFDEMSNTWAMYKSMADARTQHAMVPFGVQNVYGLIVMGGRNKTGVLQTSEKLDTTTMTWQKLGSTGLMTTARAQHTAIVIEGGRILVAGGVDNTEKVLNTVEVFNSVSSLWQANPTGLSAPRIGHTATIGKNGTFVVIAGGKSTTSGAALSSLDYCDGTTEIPNCSLFPFVLLHGRANHKAIREQPPLQQGFPLPPPRIFFIGGETGTDKVKDVEVFDPLNKVFLPPPGQLADARSNFDALLVTGSLVIGNGTKIVVTGGYGDANEPLKSTELFDTSGMLASKNWQSGPDMMMGRASHTMATLSDGRILAIGGVTATTGTSEVLQCSTDAECPDGRFCADGFCCDTECTGVCEACNSVAPGHAPGTCFPIAGRPRPGHGDCIAAEDANSLNCEGKCGGFDRDVCDYPVGKPCGNECNDATSQPLTCSDKGICDVYGAKISCGTYTCNTVTNDVCLTKCTDNKECITGYKCNVTSGACTEAQVQCGTRTNDDGSVREVLEYVADPKVISEECGAFKCDPIKSECHTFCTTAYDCISGYTCDSNKTCVKQVFEDTVGDVTGCSTAPGNESSRFGWLAALAMAGVVAARRNRARA